MEVKVGAIVFLVLLSVLLFGCLMLSTVHNASKIAELQLRSITAN